MVVGKDSLDRAGPARRLAAPAQAREALALRIERPDTGMDRAPERDTARLLAEQADTPAHTPGGVDRARMAGRRDRVTAIWRHLTPLRYTADTGRTASGQQGAVRAPEQVVAPVVSTAVEEQPVPLVAWLASAQSPAPLEPDCPAVQNGGSVAPRIPDSSDHPVAWRSRNAGRLFRPRR
jgi:hypothetical protein